jgi:hypothetical protein
MSRISWILQNTTTDILNVDATVKIQMNIISITYSVHY